jgi:hypothetical protein
MALTRPKYSSIYDTDWKNSVKLATTADVGDLRTSNAQPNSVDGVSVAINDRILVKDQGNTMQNGLYFVRTVGTGANGWWTRTLDANQDAFVTSGLTVDVTNGSTNSGKQYKINTPDPIFLGNTGLSFSVLTAQPGGANTQVQFNDNNSIGGSAYFTYNKYSNLVTIGGNILAAGNVTAPYYFGNGALLTGIVVSGSTYGNAQVATYLQNGNIANVSVAGNVTAAYFLGNGSQLTGIASGYSNVQVATYLPTYSGTVGASLINSTGNILATGLSVFGNVTLGSLTSPGSLNTLAGNVTIYGASSMLNVIGNIIVNNTAISSSNVTGAIVTTGGIGVGGNLYVGQRVGYVWGANNVSSVYQVFNNSTNSLDTVFG